MKAYNIMEDIVIKYLDEMLEKYKDICTCAKCRDAIAAQALSLIPAKYVTTEKGAMHTMMEQVRVEQASVILKALVESIEFIRKHPAHNKPSSGA